MKARGALIERYQHPEWRQFLMRAAMQRADELSRLRDLPDTPTRKADAPKLETLAGLPDGRGAAEPNDETGAIGESTRTTLPVDIGEASSTELPVSRQEERPPAVHTRERVRRNDVRKPRPRNAIETAGAAQPGFNQSTPAAIQPNANATTPSDQMEWTRAGNGSPD
jgi:hypothetical protein